ncbi:MAG TPA: matrixin family metalloprotease [Parcubacteria group bacterium]|nr:matrixin family metalloprotease [Parcubacteria group bacterium]
MSRIINYIFLGTVLVVGFVYKDVLSNVWIQSFNRYFPCKYPISYSIGSFDTRFGISEEFFLEALKDAEKMWETSINKDLFRYKEDGGLKVNLIFDERQQVTTELKKIENNVENTKSNYDSLKIEYDKLVANYEIEKKQYQLRLSAFESKKDAYDAEVAKVNSRGGGNKETVARLNTEKNYLISEMNSLNSLQYKLNNDVKKINSLSETLNTLVKNLNLNVNKFNTIGDSLGEEFEEGVYVSDREGRKIDIYQFDNRTKLVRLLAHELGHALGLDHNDDSKAIMYRLNNGVNEKLTATDLMDLKELCGI